MNDEELQKLKNRIGTKLFNNVVSGINNSKSYSKEAQYKRKNKNRPREESSKKPTSRFREIIPVQKKICRDPRFDALCGEFNEKAFKNSYSFLHDYRKNDCNQLKEELKELESIQEETLDENQLKHHSKQLKKIKFLIQRLDNQIREEEKKRQQIQQEKEKKQEFIESIKRGEKPTFERKCEYYKLYIFCQFLLIKNLFTAERRLTGLISQYESLKHSGKLKKHIERIRKKKSSKNQLELENSLSD